MEETRPSSKPIPFQERVFVVLWYKLSEGQQKAMARKVAWFAAQVGGECRDWQMEREVRGASAIMLGG